MKKIWFKCPYCCERYEMWLKFFKAKDNVREQVRHYCFSYLCKSCDEWFPVSANCYKCRHDPCYIRVKTREEVRRSDGAVFEFFSDLLANPFNENNIRKYLRTIERLKDHAFIKAYGNMHRALQIMVRQGRARFTEIQNTEWTNIELQKLLILGLAERVPKDCELCQLRIQCLGSNWKCLLVKPYVYAATELGRQALKVLDQVPSFIPKGCKQMPRVRVDVKPSEEWIEYSKSHIW